MPRVTSDRVVYTYIRLGLICVTSNAQYCIVIGGRTIPFHLSVFRVFAGRRGASRFFFFFTSGIKYSNRFGRNAIRTRRYRETVWRMRTKFVSSGILHQSSVRRSLCTIHALKILVDDHKSIVEPYDESSLAGLSLP